MLVCDATAVLLSCQSQAAPADVISCSPTDTGEVCPDLLLGMKGMSVKVKTGDGEDGDRKWQTRVQDN